MDIITYAMARNSEGGGGGGGGGSVTVDDHLDNTSEHPVQNKVLADKLETKYIIFETEDNKLVPYYGDEPATFELLTEFFENGYNVVASISLGEGDAEVPLKYADDTGAYFCGAEMDLENMVPYLFCIIGTMDAETEIWEVKKSMKIIVDGIPPAEGTPDDVITIVV